MAKLNVWGIEIGHKEYDGWHRGRPNSVGGVSVCFSFKNNTDKTIKYVSFWFTPYNSVYDEVRCSIRGVSTYGANATGPFAPGSVTKSLILENAWYNHTISSVSLSHVRIEYMDGTSEKIDKSEIDFSVPAGVSTGGCYVATCVYGSYDCPEVWTLRRFRDETLGSTWYGRTFIRTYYAISPTLVRWFGHTNWFKKLWRGKLDHMVAKLKANGVEDTPYEDKEW